MPFIHVFSCVSDKNMLGRNVVVRLEMSGSAWADLGNLWV
jgi:hypothetical protein